MTSIDSEKERLIRLEERHESLLARCRTLEIELNNEKHDNSVLRQEVSKYAAIKDQHVEKGFSGHLIDTVKLCIAVIAGLLGIKYGAPK